MRASYLFYLSFLDLSSGILRTKVWVLPGAQANSSSPHWHNSHSNHICMGVPNPVLFFAWAKSQFLWQIWFDTYYGMVVLEKTLESPLDCKEIQPVHSERDQPWDFLGGNDAKAETPVLWPPHAKSWLIGKGSDAGRGWGQEEKGMTEDEMTGWHHWLDEREFEWTPEVGDGQGGLACYNSWGRKEPDTTERLNWTKLKTL